MSIEKINKILSDKKELFSDASENGLFIGTLMDLSLELHNKNNMMQFLKEYLGTVIFKYYLVYDKLHQVEKNRKLMEFGDFVASRVLGAFSILEKTNLPHAISFFMKQFFSKLLPDVPVKIIVFNLSKEIRPVIKYNIKIDQEMEEAELKKLSKIIFDIFNFITEAISVSGSITYYDSKEEEFKIADDMTIPNYWLLNENYKNLILEEETWENKEGLVVQPVRHDKNLLLLLSTVLKTKMKDVDIKEISKDFEMPKTEKLVDIYNSNYNLFGFPDDLDEVMEEQKEVKPKKEHKLKKKKDISEYLIKDKIIFDDLNKETIETINDFKGFMFDLMNDSKKINDNIDINLIKKLASVYEKNNDIRIDEVETKEKGIVDLKFIIENNLFKMSVNKETLDIYCNSIEEEYSDDFE